MMTRSMIKISNIPRCGRIAGSLLAVVGCVSSALAQPDFVRGGEAGFVVSHIQYAFAEEGAEDTGACPDGMNRSYVDPRDAYVNLPPIADAAGKSFDELERAARAIASANPEIKSFCLNPELGSPDPNHRPVTGGNVRVAGIDLDGRDSVQGEAAESGSCPHGDFAGVNGERGIDNQYFRVVGCNKGYQPSGQANSFNTAQLTGAWGILIKLSKVDDLHNDDHVDVDIYANGDPIELSPDREPLGYATYTVHAEPRFQAHTRGYIENGVLYTEPVEVRIPHDINAMYTDRVLRDARLQVAIGENGVMAGYLAGYAPVEEQYDLEFGYREARVDTSERIGTPGPETAFR